MPKSSINFQNTVIYKIQHIEKDDLIYIGHTTNFTKRKNQHKYDCYSLNGRGYKVYKIIRENGGWELFNMIELYKFPCNNSREAEFEEDKVMREYKSCTSMNSQLAFTTPEESKQRRSEQKKEYREKNKDKIKTNNQKYRLENLDKIKTKNQKYRLENLDKIKKHDKEYRENNKDKIKQNYEKNKDIYLEKAKQKITCECGSECRIYGKQKHFRSIKHLKYLESKNKIEQ